MLKISRAQEETENAEDRTEAPRRPNPGGARAGRADRQPPGRPGHQDGLEHEVREVHPEPDPTLRVTRDGGPYRTTLGRHAQAGRNGAVNTVTALPATRGVS